MTEKRFKEMYPDIIRSSCCFTDNGKGISDKEVVDLLNEQHEQIQILKATNGEMEDYLARLEEENEQLKQFQDRVFSWIDMHLQRLPTLIDDEFNSDNEFADPSLYSGALQILETMKKELKGDV